MKLAQPVEPFLRWAGGKRWLAPALVPILAKRLGGTFREPFLGAGAMFLALKPPRAALSDINDDLVCTWNGVRDEPDVIISMLQNLPVGIRMFKRVRKARPRNPIQRAVRFIYLNRTCYGGLYRTNKKGRFNVPYGGGDRDAERLWSEGILANVSSVCRAGRVAFRTEDFGIALKRAKKGDVCYLDPTFSTRKRVNFDRYNSNPFGWADQERLAISAQAAATRGSLVVISNVDCKEVRELYSGEAMFPVLRQTGFGRANGGPCTAGELLVVLDSRRHLDQWKAVARSVRKTSRPAHLGKEPEGITFRPLAPTDQ